MPSVIGSTPSRARSGISTATLRGSKTTTSPNVRGSTNRSSRARHARQPGGDVGVRRARLVDRRDEHLPAHPQVDHDVVARVERRAAGTCRAAGCRRWSCRSARRSIACRDVRRTVRSRPTSTCSMRRPTRCDVQPTTDGLDLGQLGHDRRAGVAVSASAVEQRRAPPTRPPARRSSSTGRCPRPGPGRRPARWPRTSWRGRVRSRAARTPARRRTGAPSAPAARVLKSSRSSCCAAAASGLGEQPLDQLARGDHATVDVHRADHRLERVAEDRRLHRGRRRRPRPCPAAGTARGRSRAATSASADALTTLLRRSVSLPSGRS